MVREVATWNVSRGLGIENRNNDIYEGIKVLDSDFIVLNEAFATSDEQSNLAMKAFHDTPTDEVLGAINDFAQTQGYNAVHIPYDDVDDTKGRPTVPAGFAQHMVVLGRSTVSDVTPVRLNSRNGARANLRFGAGDTPMPLIGVHLDDRSETARLAMVDSLKMEIGKQDPAIILGDMNSMHRKSIVARIARSALIGVPASRIKNERKADLLTRFRQMADGATQDRLAAAGFKDADPTHEGTFMASGITVGQVDHILGRHVIFGPLHTMRLTGSDHKAIKVPVFNND